MPMPDAFVATTHAGHGVRVVHAQPGNDLLPDRRRRDRGECQHPGPAHHVGGTERQALRPEVVAPTGLQPFTDGVSNLIAAAVRRRVR